MKKIFFVSFIFISLFTSCSQSFITGKQVFSFTNNSTKDVYVNVSGQDSVFVAIDKTETTLAYADADFNIDSCYRCDLKFSAMGNYSISDAVGRTVTVYNSSTRDIVLYENKKYIGSYADLLSHTSETINIHDVNIRVTIPAGNTVTFAVYTNNPSYTAYFNDNNMSADLSLLSFQ